MLTIGDFMKRKGFTLVELLAVIVILGIILAIAVPNIINLINNAKNDAYERQKDLIVDAAQKYVLQYGKNIVWTNDTTVIYLRDLQNVDILNNPLKDPRGGFFNNTLNGTRVTVTRNSNNYTYTIIAVGGPDTTPPIITLLGTSTVTIDQGSTYADAGATALDDTDGDITSRIIAANNVNTSVVGTYTVTYDVVDNAGNNAVKVTRTVNVNAPPSADISGASVPVLSSNMIPVRWNGTTWVKADSNNFQGVNKWYDYDSKIWANAVTVTGATRATYQSAALGTEVLMNDILTFFVWIPRYKYLISAGAGPKEITIVFESKITAKSLGDAVTTYLTHPSFTFNGTELSGIWASKFEATGAIGAITVKPNLISLKMQTVSALFNATRAMQNAGNSYGFPTTGIDTHMMKNMEWGSVTYLSHSKYGINSEIWINPADNFTTGCAGDSVSSVSTTGCLRTYNTANGVKASTTGNIYGIYDMNGGTYEYVMGNYKNTLGGSGFVSMPASQYYDNYNSSLSYKGDATNAEFTNGWYNDYQFFVDTSNSWFYRGGDYSGATSSGAFSYLRNTGAMGNASFRIVISP